LGIISKIINLGYTQLQLCKSVEKVKYMTEFQSIKDILQQKSKTSSKKPKYISRAYQDYGYRLAEELNDLKHKSLYIKLARETSKAVLEKAKSYVADYPNAKRKGAIFMWKLKQLHGKIELEPKKKKTKPKKLTLF